jgi:hypothetical protein
LPGVRVELSHAEVCEAIEAYVRGSVGIHGALASISTQSQHGSPSRYTATVVELNAERRERGGFATGGGAADSDAGAGGAADSR